MNYVNRNWKVILSLSVFAIAVLNSIWFFYWSNSSLTLTLRDSTVFNNVVTPIVTFVSGLLFFWH